MAGARQARRCRPTTRRRTGATNSVERGPTAAYAAYQRATAPAAAGRRARAARQLFARHEMWRPALDAYRASLDRRDDEDARKTYEDMREKHGFRIVDYKVDNESASPRVCFNFSDSLARKTDFAPYVAVSGAANTAISAEDSRSASRGSSMASDTRSSCAQGLPSAVGESPSQGGGLRNLCARPIAAGAFRRQGLCAAAPGPAGRAARHGQHGESGDRRLSDRRPQPARRRPARRFPEAHQRLARRARSNRRTA